MSDMRFQISDSRFQISERVFRTCRCAGLGRWILGVGCWVLVALNSGCVSGSVSRLAENLGRAAGAHDDPELVRAALPAYLLLIDGLIEGDPRNPALLEAGAALYGAYGGLLAGDDERAAKLTDRAMAYAERAWRCRRAPDLRTCRFDVFSQRLAAVRKKDAGGLYGLGAAWAGWIRARPQAVAAAAEIPRVEAIMERVTALDPLHGDGSPHMIVGSLAALLPADLGGDPEKARRAFERAMELADGRNLMIPVLYARQYAVATGNRTLYERLLRQVVDAPPAAGEHRLMNVVARERARLLLQDAEQLFEEAAGR